MDCVCERKKYREEAQKKALLNRLSRMEGQIRGLKRMIEEDGYCVDVLTQVSAVQSALRSFSRMLLSDHMKTCMVEDIQKGNEAAVDEILQTLQKLMY